MIECICIDDSGRPSRIPPEKWPKKDRVYHIVFAILVKPQMQLAVELDEIQLGQDCLPYEYFLAKRFSINGADFDKMVELIRECAGINTSIEKIKKEIGHVETYS